MRFTQHIVFYADNEEAVLGLLDTEVAASTGPVSARLLRFRDKPGRYVFQADFASTEAAEANNDRPETQQWAERLRAVATSEIKWENFDVLGEM